LILGEVVVEKKSLRSASYAHIYFFLA
jgi:hypothetical protein